MYDLSTILDKPSFVKEIYALNDIDTLREIIIRKERERQSIANDLEVAARIGLVISETNEALQIKVCINRQVNTYNLTNVERLII